MLALLAVVLVALAQGAALALFTVFALDGDSLGIAGGIAQLIALPFLTLTALAIVLARSGRRGIAAGLAVLSGLMTVILFLAA